MPFEFSPRAAGRDLLEYVGRYSDPREKGMMEAVGPRIRQHGCCSLSDLELICRWKSPRPLPYVLSNEEEDVRDITGAALASGNERLRIYVPQILAGVGWPMASVILHFGFDNQYPILDYRALWSLQSEPKACTFEFWWDYTVFCRQMAS
jgi:hypothetical protein